MSQSQTPPHLLLSTLLLLAIVVAAIISIHAATAQDWKTREEDDDSWNNLLGVEEYCKEGKEECLKGRMLHEAHLDYIYTQHHPKP